MTFLCQLCIRTNTLYYDQQQLHNGCTIDSYSEVQCSNPGVGTKKQKYIERNKCSRLFVCIISDEDKIFITLSSDCRFKGGQDFRDRNLQ